MGQMTNDEIPKFERSQPAAAGKVDILRGQRRVFR